MEQSVLEPRRSRRKLCTVTGCEKFAHARGLCDKHRTQIRRHGRLTPERELGRPRPKLKCTVDNCEATRVARGLCSRHYSQVRRHGAVLPDRDKARKRSRLDFFETFGSFPSPTTEDKSSNKIPSDLRYNRDLTRLLGLAATDVHSSKTSSVRAELQQSEQRLLDIFRFLHAHRRGSPHTEVVARNSGLTHEERQLWLEHVSPNENKQEASFAGRGPSVDFAWLLGLYAAIRRSPAGNSPRPLRVRLDREEADELTEITERLFDRPPSVRKVDDQYDVFFGSKELSRYLHDISRGNTVVPWEHLATVAERRAFLASFLRRRCSLSAIGGVRPILAVGKRMATTLRNDLLFLFAQLGIYPAFDESRIFLQSLPELQKVLDCGLILNAERHKRLSDLIERAPYDSLDIDVELYYRVLSGEEDKLVPAETRRRWLLDELPPKIKRIERLAALFDTSPDPEVIALLFRGLGLPPHEARDQGCRRSLREVLSLMITLRRAKLPRELWNTWLGMSLEDINAKLGVSSSTIIDVGGQSFQLTPKARMRYLQAYGLQPEEFDDFSVCLDHIRGELTEALVSSSKSGQIASKSLVFSIQNQTIQSIRLLVGG